MIRLLQTTIGRLRILAFLEGLSLLVLIFIAVPMKYLFNNPQLSKSIGPVHGAIFLVFVLNAFRVAYEQQWTFKTTTWKLLVACFIPFGTFYIDHKILRRIETRKHTEA